ncbi:MAG: hypothetical protein AB7N76_33740 [Planctomycetota bacterium]
MKPEAIRAQFRAFVGPDDYRRFVRAANGPCREKGALLFWQERLWCSFVSEVPTAETSPAGVLDLFRVCDVHDQVLREQSGFPPPIRDTKELQQARDRAFPFAAGEQVGCARCWEAREVWVHEHTELCQVLLRQTTYAEFCVRRLGLAADSMRVRERAAEIAARMLGGDELWEWDEGGWDSLRGRAGVAIVRAGQIVERWCELRS